MSKKEITGLKLYEVCKELIAKNYNRYFSAKSLINDVIANIYDVSLKIVLNGNKSDFNPYYEDRKSLRYRITRILRKLDSDGLIVKYSKFTWEKVKASAS